MSIFIWKPLSSCHGAGG